MTDRELFEQALEALENPWKAGPDGVANAITALRERLAQPEPPPECKTEEEKTAFAFGWLKAMEAQRVAQPEQKHVIDCPRCGHCCPQQPEQEPVIDKLGCVPAGDTSPERVDEAPKQRQEQKPPVKTYCGGKPNYCTPEGREDIIKMAREAGAYSPDNPDDYAFSVKELYRFAALVAAAERERIIAANGPEIERINTYIKKLEAAVKVEREACAQLLDEMAARDKLSNYYAVAAKAIRQRGQQ